MNHLNRLLIICANLTRRKDRRFVMKLTFPEIMGTPITFLKAIDGEIVPEWKLRPIHPEATQSSYAVRLTKRIALRNFLRSDHEFLLYLEDDVIVGEDFAEAVEEAMARNHDVVFLGGKHYQGHDPVGSGRWRKCVRTFNNHALLISRQGARKLLKIWSKWTEAWSDQELQIAMMTGKVDCWCIQPWVAFQRETQSDNWGNPDFVSLVRMTPPPRMHPDDLAVLDAASRHASIIVEYGSGGTTLHLASLLRGKGRLLSVEHREDRYQEISERIQASELSLDYLLRKPRPNRPQDGICRYLPSQLEGYLKAPLELVKPGTADLVFVGGPERINCSLEAAKLLRPRGFLIVQDFWSHLRYRVRLPEILDHFDYLLESPVNQESMANHGLAVFQRKAHV
jgi:hypothetical protein